MADVLIQISGYVGGYIGHFAFPRLFEVMSLVNLAYAAPPFSASLPCLSPALQAPAPQPQPDAHAGQILR